MNSEASWLVWLTGFLALATIWLAVATHQMAKATKKSIELESVPYLSFKDIHFTIGFPPPGANLASSPLVCGLGIIVRNPGKVKVRYRVNSLQMTLNSITIPNPQFSNRGSYVFPGEQSIFHYGKINIPGSTLCPIPGTADFEIEYWSSAQSKKISISQKVQFTILSLQPFMYESIYLQEEHSE